MGHSGSGGWVAAADATDEQGHFFVAGNADREISSQNLCGEAGKVGRGCGDRGDLHAIGIQDLGLHGLVFRQEKFDGSKTLKI